MAVPGNNALDRQPAKDLISALMLCVLATSPRRSLPPHGARRSSSGCRAGSGSTVTAWVSRRGVSLTMLLPVTPRTPGLRPAHHGRRGGCAGMEAAHPAACAGQRARGSGGGQDTGSSSSTCLPSSVSCLACSYYRTGILFLMKQSF